MFVISLDFELEYGMEDSVNKNTENMLLKTRTIIPQILNCFEKYQVHATWATVGKLFATDKKNMYSYYPIDLPTYSNILLSSYEYDSRIKNDEKIDPYHYALELINKIKMTPGQELGSHTFSHYYCNTEGQTENQFKEDIKSAINIMQDNCNIKPISIVFPKNEINDKYVDYIRRMGFTSYRGAPNQYIYKSNNFLIKIYRFVSAYFGKSSDGIYMINEILEKSICNIKASAFLRPYSKHLFFLEPLKIHRIKKQMKFAAKHKGVFHLWWHPHNFGNNSIKNMNNLIEILKYYQYLNEKYNFKSYNMMEISNKILNL